MVLGLDEVFFGRLLRRFHEPIFVVFAASYIVQPQRFHHNALFVCLHLEMMGAWLFLQKVV